MRFENQVSLYDTEAILSRFEAQDTQIEIAQGKISAIISESELLELQGGSSTMYGKLADVELSVEGLSAQFSTLSTRYDTLTGQYTTLSSRVAAYKASVDGLSVNVSSIQTDLSTNYSTTAEMQAYADDVGSNAISTAAADATAKANSAISTAAADATTKANNAIDTAADDATTKANNAIDTAADDATTKANNAISTAAADATTKANNAISTANEHTAELLESYSTTTEMNAAINASAEGISANVSSAVSRIDTLESWRQDAELRITSDAIVSTVTSSDDWGTLSSQVSQNATAIESKITSADAQSLISQSASSIRLSASSIAWSSTYSSMTSNGTLTCQNANIKGTITGSSISGSTITSLSNYGFRKAVMDRAYIEFYDMNTYGNFMWAGAFGPGQNYPSSGAEDMQTSIPDMLVINGKSGVMLDWDGSSVVYVGCYSGSLSEFCVQADYMQVHSTSYVYGDVYLQSEAYLYAPDGDVVIDGLSVKEALYWVYARMDGGLFGDDDDSGELIG